MAGVHVEGGFVDAEHRVRVARHTGRALTREAIGGQAGTHAARTDVQVVDVALERYAAHRHLVALQHPYVRSFT